MRDRLKDLFNCFILSLKLILIPIIAGILIGVISGIINKDFHVLVFLGWIYRMGIYMACFGLFLCAIALMKPIHMNPLNHEKIWKQNFKVFGLIRVIGYSSVFIFLYSIILERIIFGFFL